MAGIVRLKHITRKNNWLLYFYNGFANVRNGVVELPADNFTRIRRAWLLGFRLTEDGQPIKANRYDDIVAQATVDSHEEQTSEARTNSGRQPRATDRVREGSTDSSGDSDGGGTQGVLPSGSGESEEAVSATAGDGE